ncbi:MAG: hypothetical protein KAS64_10930 [Spirochaetes bacterium]|nr:hypothetical protein [Spirochaetota bacterium]
MKKVLVLFLILTIVVFAFGACKGKDAPSDSDALNAAKGLYQDMLKNSQTALTGLEAATDGKSAAKVVAAYASSLRNILIKTQGMMKKYPKFNPAGNKDLAEVTKNYAQVQVKLAALIQKISKKYAKDKDFINALKTMGSIMGK